jgi:hypothetical protein
MRRNGRKAKDHGVDCTPYQGDRKISYVSYHNLHGKDLLKSTIYWINT